MPVGEITVFPEGAGAQEYDATQNELNIDGDPPDGLIFHCAGELEGRFQVFNVWETKEHAERFTEDRLRPAIKAVVGQEAYEAMPEADRTFAEVHSHVVIP